MIAELVVEQVVSPMFEGMTFGAVGAYELWIGSARGELDPADALNAGIVNLERAPRNARGRVEYSVDLQMLKPVHMERGNGRLVYDVLNRGGKRATGPHINGGPLLNDPRLAAHAGTGFLMRRGYTIVWSGWQGNVEPGEGRMLARLPFATDGERPIAKDVREEFIDDSGADPFVGTLTYPAADLELAKSQLTVRQRQHDARCSPPDLAWRYLSPKRVEVQRPQGFDAGAIYAFFYPAKDPTVMGIGFASVRDVVAFLRYEAADARGTANPLAVGGSSAIEKAIGVGFSQSGRFLRDFAYQGFNQDERRRQVFDGIIPVIAGSRKTNVNHEFAKAGNFSRQHETHFTRGDQFPFSYATTTDPLTGKTDGLLETCRQNGTCPKVFHLDTDTEFWQARSSLVVFDGERHLQQPENVRLYLATGCQHSPHGKPPAGLTQFPNNPLPYAPFMRALIAAMDAWISEGMAPPASRFPSVVDGTLASPAKEHYGIPDIPGLAYAATLNTVRVTDYEALPPREGPHYPVLVNRCDADGNGMAGIRHPLLEAPLATHLGWNLRTPGHAEGDLAETWGSRFPFARTKAERLAARDPRLSLEERYPCAEAYLGRVEEACIRLVRERLLLAEDGERILAEARANGPVPR
ncbi:MAG: hypothetical protein HY423_03745 [Candidatus Lambdaproteobacteria bacterium]|nr:hypothetical protein [Candidatus Lambdaproteobacteria bacterium]